MHPPRGVDEFDAAAGFYDAVAAGYDQQVEGLASNDEVRRRFRERVSQAAGPGGLILDYGCGTGIDAQWYAECGHRVLAYDVSAQMVDQLRLRCAGEVASGCIAPMAGRLDVLERALENREPVSVIAANFAVLNHVRDLGPLLHRLASHLAPQGLLVASVLNPFYRGDMLRAWWWRSLVRSGWTGAIRVEGQVTTHRHFTSAVRRAAAPDFVLEEVRAANGGSGLASMGSNYLFLMLRRCS
ncbi:MAG TPA: class I SAM-dependent methyltransferase [Burkholderiaceae bacterium]